jgi:hypothetical protein
MQTKIDELFYLIQRSGSLDVQLSFPVRSDLAVIFIHWVLKQGLTRGNVVKVLSLSSCI